MPRKKYVPERGDIVITNFDPSAGHKQDMKRPALVLSLGTFNSRVGLALVAPNHIPGARTWVRGRCCREKDYGCDSLPADQDARLQRQRGQLHRESQAGCARRSIGESSGIGSMTGDGNGIPVSTLISDETNNAHNTYYVK